MCLSLMCTWNLFASVVVTTLTCLNYLYIGVDVLCEGRIFILSFVEPTLLGFDAILIPHINLPILEKINFFFNYFFNLGVGWYICLNKTQSLCD